LYFKGINGAAKRVGMGEVRDGKEEEGRGGTDRAWGKRKE